MTISTWPSYSEDEIKAVSNVLLSNKVNYWTGTLCKEFEEKFAEWVGVDYAIAVANGSVALELALKALGISTGDEVVVTPRSFIASASSVVLAGATPVFADVDRNTQNLTAETIAKVLSPRTRAIICVHHAGMPCDMDSIMNLANIHGLKVIEDCAQAHGALYKGRSVGSIGQIGAWSFCQDKIISTGGEGGMVTTNDFSLFESMWSFKDHGKSWQEIQNNTAPSYGPRLIHTKIGTNWRMMEIQAAIGILQLNKVEEWSARRNKIAAEIGNVCNMYSALRVPEVPKHLKHAYYRFYVFIKDEFLAFGWTRNRLIEEARAKGIPCIQGSSPEIYLEPAFQSLKIGPATRLPVAQELGESSIAFLVHPTISNEELDKILFALNELLSVASL